MVYSDDRTEREEGKREGRAEKEREGGGRGETEGRLDEIVATGGVSIRGRPSRVTCSFS